MRTGVFPLHLAARLSHCSCSTCRGVICVILERCIGCYPLCGLGPVCRFTDTSHGYSLECTATILPGRAGAGLKGNSSTALLDVKPKCVCYLFRSTSITQSP